VDERAEDLRRNIVAILREQECSKVNVIAHSMGGLDTRHMMFNDRGKGDIHKCIASLTTISTPHWGSPFADWGLKNLPMLLPMAKDIGLNADAMADLTVDRCTKYNNEPVVQRFEEQCEKVEKIVFRTYAGRQKFVYVMDALKAPFLIIQKAEGENDGLVSVTSAKWRDRYFREVLDGTDHLNELGWRDPLQPWVSESGSHLLQRIHDLYAGIAAKLP
jgi:triacylglycerol lipase